MEINFADYLKQRRKSSLKNELVSRAVGAKAGLKVLDATAGLCRDAFILASLGYKVTALEKNKTIFNLLQKAYVKALDHQSLSQVAENLKILNEDFLGFDASGFDVIYLDPMFPEKKKSALPGKEMQFLQKVLENEKVQDLAMLKKALENKGTRVVIKRPAKSKALMEGFVMQVTGNSIRFDVYLQSRTPHPILA